MGWIPNTYFLLLPNLNCLGVEVATGYVPGDGKAQNGSPGALHGT